MAKKNGTVMKVHPLLKDSIKELSLKTGVPQVRITENFGRQVQTQLKENEGQFMPTFPKLRKIIPLKNKKASVVDLFYLLAIFFIISVGFLVASNVWGDLYPKYATKFNDSSTSRFAIGKINTVSSILDNIFLIFFILCVIGIVVISTVVRAEPAFYFIFVLMILFGLVGAAVFSNTYEKITETSTLDSSEFPVQNYVMTNLPYIFVVLGLAAIAIIYAKIRLAT